MSPGAQASWRRRARVLLRRLHRAEGTPHEIALGFALASYLAILPTPGLSIVAGFALALVVPMSKVSLALGFAVFNPLVCVFLVYPWALPIGQQLLQVMLPMPGDVSAPALRWLAEAGSALVLGAAVAGLLVAIPAYLLILRLVTLYRARRRPRPYSRGPRPQEIDGE